MTAASAALAASSNGSLPTVNSSSGTFTNNSFSSFPTTIDSTVAAAAASSSCSSSSPAGSASSENNKGSNNESAFEKTLRIVVAEGEEEDDEKKFLAELTKRSQNGCCSVKSLCQCVADHKGLVSKRECDDQANKESLIGVEQCKVAHNSFVKVVVQTPSPKTVEDDPQTESKMMSSPFSENPTHGNFPIVDRFINAVVAEKISEMNEALSASPEMRLRSVTCTPCNSTEAPLASSSASSSSHQNNSNSNNNSKSNHARSFSGSLVSAYAASGSSSLLQQQQHPSSSLNTLSSATTTHSSLKRVGNELEKTELLLESENAQLQARVKELEAELERFRQNALTAANTASVPSVSQNNKVQEWKGMFPQGSSGGMNTPATSFCPEQVAAKK